MSLELIVGPPNSGRAGEVLARLRASLDRDPLLIVPTGDDIARFERDLCAEGRPQIGATIRTFASLTDEIAAAAAADVAPALTPPQRLALIRAATASTPLRLLARSSRSRGFAAALDLLIAELQAALVSPTDLRAAAEAAGEAEYELELATLYEAYERLRDGAGRSDSGSLAVAAADALRATPDAWGERPVLVYGFDDLTEAQLELLRLLARACEVTVAVNYADRRALAARATLLARLRDELGGSVAAELDFDPGYTQQASLRHIDRELFEPLAGAVSPDDGIRLLECAGERGEAEAVGIEIARLLADGVPPDDVVIALRRPSVDGPLFASVLREMGIPVALEADVPLAGTAVGRGLIALCRAAGDDAVPEDLLAHLRADPSIAPGAVDWLERSVARNEVATVDELAARWESPPALLTRVGEAGTPTARVQAVAAGARRLAEAVHRDAAPLAGERTGGTPLDPIELRAGVAAAELLEELAIVGRLPGCPEPDLADAAEALETAGVRAWRGTAEGRVRIVSPYRVRAGRAAYLFCAALQEGIFPGRGALDPLLGEESRARLGIPALRRREQAEEERYLFHVCASRPVERLCLSWRSSDEDGHPAARSPFVDEVLDLLGGEPAAESGDLKRTRSLAQSVPAATEAPTPRVLARAVALRAGRDAERQREMLGVLGVGLETAGEVLGLCAPIPDPAAKPGPLSHPEVLAAMRERKRLSAGSLEGWIQCSYQWFVDHELAPQRLEPEADPLWLGGVVHAALDRLYREAPGEDSIPRPWDAGRWKARFNELLDEVIAESDSPETPSRRLALARLRVQVEAFLDEEAGSTTVLRPRPDLLERGFGFTEEDDDPGELALGEIELRGRIDRIDVEPGGRRAVLRDYKTSRQVPGVTGIGNEGKLQLQLYMLVARERLGLEPIGGLYQPLGAYGDRRPRGMVVRSECGEGGLYEGMDISVKGDALSEDDFEDALEGARERAIANGARMRRGDITRDPLGGTCSEYCVFQPICRLERALGLEEDAGNGTGNGNGNGQ
jgi:ATP-dependent helicase/DNAse subunit B